MGFLLSNLKIWCFSGKILPETGKNWQKVAKKWQKVAKQKSSI